MRLPEADKTGAVAWMIRNPVTANLIMWILLIGGLITAGKIRQEVFPEFTMDRIDISVSYPGAGPEEVEQGIILVIEENVRGVTGVGKVTSSAREGSGTVNIEVAEGSDPQKVYQDILQQISRIRTFPENSEEPNVSLAGRKQEVLNIALFGDIPEKLLREQAEIVRDTLLADSSITLVELEGVRDYEITVSVSREMLRKYGLTVSKVASIIKSSALEMPGGGIKTSGGEILIRLKERRDFGHEFARLPVITAENGSTVTLGDISTVTDGLTDTDDFSYFNGKPAVLISVFSTGDETPLSVSAAAKKILEELRSTLPRGLFLEIRNDMSENYRQRLELLLKNGLFGIVLVLLVLGLFMELRLAFWVMMGIPVSFLGGMILLPWLGVSINMMSMFAFLIALGIVVDDAIVVGENIFEHHENGKTFFQSALDATGEVSVPVIFSVLTNVVTFFPLLFLPGMIGKIWYVIPVVVITVFLVSLLESLFLLPAHLAHGSDTPRTAFGRNLKKLNISFNAWFSRIVRVPYSVLLSVVLKHRYSAFAFGIGMMILILGYVKSGRIGMVPMMQVESDFSNVSVALPYGSPVEDTIRIRNLLTEAAERVADKNGGKKLMTGIYSHIGGNFRGISGGHNLSVRAYLTAPEIRTVSTREFTDLWRKETGNIPGIDTILFESDRGGPGSGSSLSLQLRHSDSSVLALASADLAGKLEQYPIVSDVDDGFTEGKDQLDFNMLPEGIALGLTALDVASQVRSFFYGSEALRQQRGRDEVKVMVRLPEEQRSSENDLSSLLLLTPSGKFVPLKDVASVRRGQAYTSIERKEGQRVVTVTANVTPASESENILSDVLKNYMPELKEKYPGLDYGFSGRQEDLREGMSALKLGFIAALIGVYALLAIPFGSYTQPMIIMVSIPFGIVGAVLAHIAMGYPLSLMSMMGIVALSGVVVNDALILIDYINSHVRDGMPLTEAVKTAGVRRFRPILLTTFTTFGGLAPMIFETSRQARFMIPMAISLGFGILFSTLITLFLIPALCLVLDDVKKILAQAFPLLFSEKTEVK